MWNLYQQSLAWGTNPSQILELDPDCGYLCWCVNDAVLYFGRWVDSKLQMRHTAGQNKGKPMYSLQQVLDPAFVEYGRRESKSLAGLMMMAGNFAGPVNDTA